jgi:DNA-binding transcriptional regulator YhcF (GntR family)
MVRNISAMIDPDNNRPQYRQLADMLRIQIASGKYAPGARLPSDGYLSQETGLPRTTVRRALDILRAEGLTELRVPKGTYVRKPPTARTVELAGDALVRTRMPTPDERRRLDVVEGVPLLVVEHAGETALYAGDRSVLRLR